MQSRDATGVGAVRSVSVAAVQVWAAVRVRVLTVARRRACRRCCVWSSAWCGWCCCHGCAVQSRCLHGLTRTLTGQQRGADCAVLERIGRHAT